MPPMVLVWSWSKAENSWACQLDFVQSIPLKKRLKTAVNKADQETHSTELK